MARITMNISDELLQDIDSYAGSLHITRTAAISVLCSQALQAEKAMNAMDEFTSMMKNAQAKNEVGK